MIDQVTEGVDPAAAGMEAQAGGQSPFTNLDYEELEASLDAELGTFSEAEQEFLAEYLTPESVALIQLAVRGLIGNEVAQMTADYFQKNADPAKQLIPVSREEVNAIRQESISGSQSSQVQPSKEATPI